MSGWTLADIRSKTRLTTGRPDVSMLSDADLDNYINRFYQLVMPKELKIFWGYTYYQFFTEANVDQYPGPTATFQTINPQAWCDGWQLCWYLSPDLFYQDYPQQENKQQIATGNGSTNSFSASISAYPVLPRSLYVTDGTQVMQDDGNGTMVNAIAPFTGGTGSIDYTTGVLSGLAFPVSPANNTNIVATSQTYMPNRPQGILYFKSGPLTDATQTVRDNQNYFVLRPVPDQVYLVKMQGIQIPPALTNTTDVPFRADLGPLLAYGASLEIFADFNQMDQYQLTLPQYNRYKDICMQDTYEEYLYQRSVPTF